jgi:hypothetical protein
MPERLKRTVYETVRFGPRRTVRPALFLLSLFLLDSHASAAQCPHAIFRVPQRAAKREGG